jgi:hypothetical protein
MGVENFILPYWIIVVHLQSNTAKTFFNQKPPEEYKKQIIINLRLHLFVTTPGIWTISR